MVDAVLVSGYAVIRPGSVQRAPISRLTCFFWSPKLISLRRELVFLGYVRILFRLAIEG